MTLAHSPISILLREGPDASEIEATNFTSRSIECPRDSGHKRAVWLDFEIKPSGQPSDISWTQYSECIITGKVRKFLADQGFTGWTTVPARVAGSDDHQDLWRLLVTGWGGLADPASGTKLIRRCEACDHPVFSGWSQAEKFLDRRNWDGSDFFVVWPLPLFIWVSDRVFEALIERDFSGTFFRSFDELTSFPTLSPGWPSHYPQLASREDSLRQELKTKYPQEYCYWPRR